MTQNTLPPESEDFIALLRILIRVMSEFVAWSSSARGIELHFDREQWETYLRFASIGAFERDVTNADVTKLLNVCLLYTSDAADES